MHCDMPTKWGQVADAIGQWGTSEHSGEVMGAESSTKCNDPTT